MAHIPDGVLSIPVLVAGAGLSLAFLSVAVKRMNPDTIPAAAVMAAAFFVSSLVSVPAGPSTVHLVLNGVMGLLLGWAVFPAVLVALLMQTLFFGHGGILSLGVNVFNIALPALLLGWVVRPRLSQDNPKLTLWLGALAGGCSVLLTAILIFVSLILSSDSFGLSAQVIAATYFPLIVVEAIISAVIVSFIVKVAPQYLT